MTVKIEDVMENLKAEDFEQPNIENVLMPQALSYMRLFSNRDYDQLTKDEQATFDRTVLMMIADWYTHPDGGGRNAGSTKYSGLNMVIDSFRVPGFPAEEDDNG